MSLFHAVTGNDAPEKSRPTLLAVSKKFGFTPNLLATMANAPALLDGYLALDGAYEGATLRPADRQLVLLTTSVENECDYCTAAHSTIAKGGLRVDAAVVRAIREGGLPDDAKLAALVAVTREIVRHRGHVAPATLEAFFAQGYSKEQLAEILIGVALKTMSNYLDHLSPVPIEAAFAAEAPAKR